MNINPLSDNYIKTLSIRQMTNQKELFDVIKKLQTEKSQKADIIINLALIRLFSLQFLNEDNITVSDVLKTEESILKFSQPFIEFQNTLSVCSSIEGDVLNLLSATINGVVDTGYRCPKSKTINKFRATREKNDKNGFLYSLESYIRGSARNNINLIYDPDDLDYFETFEQDTLTLLIQEEDEQELEEITKKEEEVPQVSLFNDFGCHNMRKAGNLYPLKKSKKLIDTGSLFDLGGAA